MRPSLRLGLLFAVFALSGFSGLIYESIWTHYLKLFLGHAAYAQTLVLAIFMGGMAVGSWLAARYSARWRSLLVGYALTEAAVGLLALAFHGVFTAALAVSYDHVIPWLGGPTAVTAYKWLLSAALILPESILLGMTFPLMSAGVLRLFPGRPGRSIGMLYFTNSIGAAIGVLASGFLLIRWLGLPGTIRLAGAINLLLGLAVWLLVRKATPPGATSSAEAPAATGKLPTGWPRLLLAVSLVTGLSSFVYEIGWIRMLSLVLGSSTHAFELMLSAFILGLAFGGLWIQRRIDRIAHPIRYLAIVQLAMGLLALSTLPLYGKTFEVMQWIVQGLEKTEMGYLWFNLSSNGIALAVMLPTTFCAGMTLPLITYVLLKGGFGERSIGAVYAANTVGAILGVFLAVHVGLPLLGLKGLLVAGAALDIGLGVLLLWPSIEGRWGRRPFAIAAATGVIALVGTALLVHLDDFKMASGVFRQGELLQPGAQRLLFHRDGKTATVSLVEETANGMRSIRTNGKSDAAIGMRMGMPPTSDEYTMSLAAAIPVMLHPNARHAAVIGFGSGLTTHSLLSCPWIERVETIEIEPEMVEAARAFRPAVERAFSDPRGRIFIDDAKAFFSTNGRKYDLIISEPSNPWVSGVAGLFSKEFYRLVRRHLNEGGIFVQWVQLYEIDLTLVASVLKALEPEFADYAMFAPNNGDLLIVASQDRPLPDTLDDRLLGTAGFSELSRRLALGSAQDFLARKVGTKRTLSGWLAALPVPANSDYQPFLDQNAARARFLGSFAWDLLDFSRVPLPSLEMLGGLKPSHASTRVNPSSYSDLSTRAFTATSLRDYHRSGWVAPQVAALAPDVFAKAARLRHLLRACGEGSATVERLDLTFNMSVAMAPYLSAPEMEEFWRSLESQPCWPSISADERRWYPLLKAVGLRDGRGMVASSQDLLRSPAGRTGASGRYVASAAMLGAIASGNRAEARRVWNDVAPALFGGGKPEMLFQVLEAESRAP